MLKQGAFLVIAERCLIFEHSHRIDLLVILLPPKSRFPMSEDFYPGCYAYRVKDWVDNNLPTMAWHFLGSHLVDSFLAHGIRFSKIDRDTVLPPELLLEIKQYIGRRYGKELPFEAYPDTGSDQQSRYA